MGKKRLDALLTERGLADTRSKAQAYIMAGEITVGGRVVTKAGSLVADDAEVQLKEKLRYVSRGGLKLEQAMEGFGIDVSGMVCLDVGASTGGFTDCLLQHGAKKVYALDTGHGQLDYSLRRDDRVAVMEKVNAHFPFELPEKVNLATIDVSFISVTSVIPNVLPHLVPPGDVVILFKPQFEAGRKDVGKGGVVRDPVVHTALLADFATWMNNSKLRLINLAASPILGADGNREFLIYVRPL